MVIICLQRGANLHMTQWMPLPVTVSCTSKIQIGIPFWHWLTRVVLDKGPLNGCVCVCMNAMLYIPSVDEIIQPFSGLVLAECSPSVHNHL